MDTEKVSDEFGHFLEYREVTGTPRGLNGPTWALVEERGGGQEVGRPPQPQSPLGGGPFPLPLPPLPPQIPRTPHHPPPPGGGGGPVTPGTPENARTYPKPFRCPNITFQYINLHVSTISRLLVMSVITSGTPNNLRYIKSHNS